MFPLQVAKAITAIMAEKATGVPPAEQIAAAKLDR
jgi:hypothetical protein